METLSFLQKHVNRSFSGFRKDMLTLFFCLASTIAIIPVFTYLYFAGDLSDKDSIMNRNNTGVVLLDRENKPFFTFYQGKYKETVSLSEIPPIAQQAVIAVEDKGFYQHPGFSLKAIIRSLVDDLRYGDLVYGGSTITQQLVKNSLLHTRKDFLRKYQEITLASEIERRFSKDEILEMYLNSAYFGEGAFGIEDASKTYFNKSAKDLSLAESAMLAGLLPAPSKYSPLNGNGDKAKERQSFVLRKMMEQGYIDQAQKEEADSRQLVLNQVPPTINSTAPHFAIMVKEELIKRYGEEKVARSGFKVKTTLDLKWQEQAERLVLEQVQSLARNGVSNGAVVVMDPISGEVKVLVGSKDWYDDEFGKVNIATSLRQPGSSFKPVVYVKALEDGLITPATVLKDQPTSFANFDRSVLDSYSDRNTAMRILSRDPNAFYTPQNYDRKFRGPVLVRQALANSLNVPAVEVMEKVGVAKVVEYAKAAGITSLEEPSNYGLSLVLGTGEVQLLELTNFYATLANKGHKNEPTLILEIIDKYDESIYRYTSNPQPVMSQENAFIVSSILSDNRARQELFGNALTVSRPAAVKTGTTDDYKDAWTVGYTPNLVVGVWVGNNDGKPMDNIAGSLGAAPIWRSLMERFFRELPRVDFEPPAGVVKLSICNNGFVLREASPSALAEYFVKGTEPKQYCNPPRPQPSSEGRNEPDRREQPSKPSNPPSEEQEKEGKDDEEKDGNPGRGREPEGGVQSDQDGDKTTYIIEI